MQSAPRALPRPSRAASIAGVDMPLPLTRRIRLARALPLLLALSFGATLGSYASHAEANCARPVGYDAHVDDNTVEITPVNFSHRGCPDADGLLREDVATHAVVRIDACSAGTGERRGFLDACVPPGKYRYGFARPYECAPSSCSTDYFVDVAVDHPLADDCKPPKGVSKPAQASSVPWGNDTVICSYGSRLARTCGAGVLVVLAFLALGVGAVVAMRRRRRRAR